MTYTTPSYYMVDTAMWFCSVIQLGQFSDIVKEVVVKKKRRQRHVQFLDTFYLKMMRKNQRNPKHVRRKGRIQLKVSIEEKLEIMSS